MFLTTIFAVIALFAAPAWCGGKPYRPKPRPPCCSHNAKTCISGWCNDMNDNKKACMRCSSDLIWLDDEPVRKCTARWDPCTYDYSACCKPLRCFGNGRDLTGKHYDPAVKYAQCVKPRRVRRGGKH